jgi:hypothetical protein
LNTLVEDLMADDTELVTLGKELSNLFQKLPPDYRQGDSRLQPEDPEQLRELVDQARALLVHSLTKEGASI